MKLIDCSCSIGYGVVNHSIINHENFTLTEKVAEVPSGQKLVELMDYCGIESALVTHETMKYMTPQYGNERILEQCSGNSRLMPVLCILPPITDAEFLPETLFKNMKDNGVKALCADPVNNRYMLNSVTMGELLSEIEKLKIPLLLSPEHGYEYIFSLLSEYPAIIVIVKGYGPWSPDRFWFPLLRKYKNIYFEIGDYETDGGIERIVSRFGADNLLFGTDFPINNMGGAIGVLTAAKINSSCKELIAHGNIERLLSEVKL